MFSIFGTLTWSSSMADGFCDQIALLRMRVRAYAGAALRGGFRRRC